MIRLVLPWLYLGAHALPPCALHRAAILRFETLCMALTALFHRPLKIFTARCSELIGSRSRFLVGRALAAPAHFAGP